MAKLREGVEEVPEEIDLVLPLPLRVNQEGEEESEKEGAVKERKK